MPTRNELIMMQALPLEIKVAKSKLRIREFFDQCDGDPVVSFSGGKDSTVLLHLVRSMYPDTPAVFADTGLEYPELREFVKTFDNVTWIKPKMNFKETINKYGYPVVSKEVSRAVYYARRGGQWAIMKMQGKYKRTGEDNPLYQRYKKFIPLISAPFLVSDSCCTVFKKSPFKTQKSPQILGTMAQESALREQHWLANGCNSFSETGASKSMPLSFWTEQDILRYIKQNGLEICSVYGDLVCGDVDEDGNKLYDTLFDDDMCGKLEFTGCQRTGCAYCGFGAHLEKGESRFERLKQTHPSLYNYCINGGAFDPEDGLWKPTKNGLGMGFVFDWCNENIKNFKIRY